MKLVEVVLTHKRLSSIYKLFSVLLQEKPRVPPCKLLLPNLHAKKGTLYI